MAKFLIVERVISGDTLCKSEMELQLTQFPLSVNARDAN